MTSGPFGFANFEDLPEESKAQIRAMMTEHKAHAEYHQMAEESVRHEIYELVNKFDEDGLRHFMILMNSMGENGMYWVGVAAGLQQMKFGVCPSCGKKHDEEIKNLAESNQDGVDWPTFVANLGDEIAQQMLTYRLMYVPGEWPHVKCRDCGMDYASLEDRMRREPDFCPGCHDKSAHG